MNDTLAPSARNDGDALASAVAKVKRHVLPLFVIMFIVNYLDRVNIGFIRPHLESDLGISAAPTALAPACSSSATRCSKCLRTCCCKKWGRGFG